MNCLGLPPVPTQTHAVAAVGGFEADGGDLLAVVDGDPHGTAQTPVFAHHVGLPAAVFLGHDLAAELQRPAAIAAEPSHDFAAVVDFDIDFAEANLDSLDIG